MRLGRQRRAFSAWLEAEPLRQPLGSRLLYLPGVGCVQADPADACGFLNQIVGNAGAVSCHHRSRGQSETQRVRLIFKVKDDLPAEGGFDFDRFNQENRDGQPGTKVGSHSGRA